MNNVPTPRVAAVHRDWIEYIDEPSRMIATTGCRGLDRSLHASLHCGGDPGCGGLLVRDANKCSPDGTRTEGTRQGNSDDIRREGPSALARQLNEDFSSLWRPVRRIAATTAAHRALQIARVACGPFRQRDLFVGLAGTDSAGLRLREWPRRRQVLADPFRGALQRWQQVVVDRLDRVAAGRRGHIDGRDDGARPVQDGHSDRAEALLELLVDDRPALLPHVGKFSYQRFSRCDGMRGQALEVDAVQVLVKFLGAERGQ